MKRSVFVALGAVAAAAAIGAGGAGGANTSATAQPAGGTTYECSGTYAYDETLKTQTCTTAGNDVVCVLRTDLPEMTQTCNVTQVSVTTTNRARIIQVATTNKGVPDQDHRQIVNVSQTNGSASNYVGVSQVIKQSLGPGHFDDTEESEPDSATTSSATPILTMQETHQLVNVVQSTNGAPQAGNNISAIAQFAKQRARALHAPSITELQNTEPVVNCAGSDDEMANMCALVDQQSTNGQNVSALDDSYLQFVRAHKTLAGMQQQGIEYGVGGMNHEIHQESAGLCKIVTKQAERQTMRAVQANVAQSQHGPTRKGAGSNQACSPDSTWTGSQGSAQVATSRPTENDIDSLVFSSPAVQDNLLEYLGVSTGSIHATQSVTTQSNGNHEKAQNSCPSPDSPSDQICAAVITCPAGEACVSSSDEDLVCPPGSFPNPETGKCEGID